MTGQIKFRAILNKEARTRGEKEYAETHRYFTLEDLMRGKLVFAYPEHWQFSEWTGLLDKNGKEIYRGDIVRMLYTDWSDQEKDKVNGVVEYKGDRYMLNFGKNRFDEDDYGHLRPGAHGYMEIIGNIYENPELLK